MKYPFGPKVAARGLVIGALLIFGGCGKTGSTGGQARDQPAQVKDHEGHDHGGKDGTDNKREGCKEDWCAEHGILEAECALCNPEVAAKLKKKGDWCKEHDTPKSQCFECNPKLKEKWVQRYRDKYGKEPPNGKQATEGKKG
jgi:cobalt-zinc-cadmium efflux system membrane fusion protein